MLTANRSCTINAATGLFLLLKKIIIIGGTMSLTLKYSLVFLNFVSFLRSDISDVARCFNALHDFPFVL